EVGVLWVEELLRDAVRSVDQPVLSQDSMTEDLVPDLVRAVKNHGRPSQACELQSRHPDSPPSMSTGLECRFERVKVVAIDPGSSPWQDQRQLSVGVIGDVEQVEFAPHLAQLPWVGQESGDEAICVPLLSFTKRAHPVETSEEPWTDRHACKSVQVL